MMRILLFLLTLLFVTPAFAQNYAVRDANGSTLNFGSSLIGGINYPYHLCASLYGGALMPCTVDSGGNQGVYVASALPAGTNALGSVSLTAGATTIGNVGLIAGSATIGNVGLIAGAAIVGKFGIDQTTAGTTNGVVVNSSALPTGAATAAKQAALGTAGSPSTDVLTVQGSATGTPLPTQEARRAVFQNDTTTALTGSATFTGTARDVGVAAGTVTPYAYFSAFFLADQTGTASIEASNDNSTWYTAATASIIASTPLILQVPVMTRYHRAKVVNGSTAQTLLKVNDNYAAN